MQPPAAEHPAAGKGCGGRGGYRTLNLYMVLPCKNNPQNMSRLREKDWREQGVSPCWQVRGKLRFLRGALLWLMVVEGGRKEEEKVLQGELSLLSERNQNQA